jgi:hypothetical protein
VVRLKWSGMLDGWTAGRLAHSEDLDQVVEILLRHRLVERDADPSGRDRAQVDSACDGRGVHLRRRGGIGVHRHGVEEGVAHQLQPGPSQCVGQTSSLAVHPLGDPVNALGTVVDGVHARHHGQ